MTTDASLNINLNGVHLGGTPAFPGRKVPWAIAFPRPDFPNLKKEEK